MASEWQAGTYCRVYRLVVARVTVDVDGYAAEGRHLGGELVKARIVLALTFVGFGHL